MNAILNRRGFFGTVGTALAGIGSALMFRKPRSVEASVPNTTRVLPIKSLDNFWDRTPDAIVMDESFPALPQRFSEEPDIREITLTPFEQPVLAHPLTQREKDEAIILGNDGNYKKELRNKFSWDWKRDEDGSIHYDEWDFTNHGATEEEFAAYKRWINDDYSDADFESAVAQANTVERVSEEGTGECHAEPRGDLEGLALSRAA
jgi:hypothetical protein